MTRPSETRLRALGCALLLAACISLAAHRRATRADVPLAARPVQAAVADSLLGMADAPLPQQFLFGESVAATPRADRFPRYLRRALDRDEPGS